MSLHLTGLQNRILVPYVTTVTPRPLPTLFITYLDSPSIPYGANIAGPSYSRCDPTVSSTFLSTGASGCTKFWAEIISVSKREEEKKKNLPTERKKITA
jgi:hypothetical protein